MVVHENEAGGLERMPTIEDVREVDFAAGDIASAHRVDCKQVQLLVHVERKQPFARFAAQGFDIGLYRRSPPHMPRPEKRIW